MWKFYKLMFKKLTIASFRFIYAGTHLHAFHFQKLWKNLSLSLLNLWYNLSGLSDSSIIFFNHIILWAIMEPTSSKKLKAVLLVILLYLGKIISDYIPLKSSCYVRPSMNPAKYCCVFICILAKYYFPVSFFYRCEKISHGFDQSECFGMWVTNYLRN